MSGPSEGLTTASRIPGYLRARPAAVLRLAAPAWTALIAATALVAVEAATRFGLVSVLDLAPPSAMIARTVVLLGDRDFVVDQVLPTVGLIAATFIIAAVVGVSIAYLLWRSPWWRRGLQPYLGVYYAVPVFAVYPILVVLFGTGSTPIVLVSVAFSTVVITTNSATGFDAVPSAVNKLAVSRRLGRVQYLTKILLPAAIPDIIAGLRLGLIYSMIGVLATEFILSARGLGHFIADSYHTFQTTDMYAGILLICLIAFTLNMAAGSVLNRMDWRRR